MANEPKEVRKQFTQGGSPIDEKFNKDLEISETNDFVDIGTSLGTDFLQGMALNTSLSIEQKMSLKAMESLINKLATDASLVPGAITESAGTLNNSALPVTQQDLDSAQGALADIL